MQDTPVPVDTPVLERPRLAAALWRAKKTLLMQPPPNATDVAQGVMLPLLQSLGVDIFDLEVLRCSNETSAEQATYTLNSGEQRLEIELLPAEASLGQLRAGSAATVVRSNGRFWRIAGRAHDLDLFDEGFAESLLNVLSRAEPHRGHRAGSQESLGGGRDTGERDHPGRRGQKKFVPAGPFERIGLAEVRSYAEPVRNMRGKLQVWFEGEAVEVTSRSAFYYLLAELALRHGREDAIHADDLVMPPDQPPASRRSLPLARPGWHLLLDQEPGAVEERTLALLLALGLERQFSARQRGEPYPPPAS